MGVIGNQIKWKEGKKERKKPRYSKFNEKNFFFSQVILPVDLPPSYSTTPLSTPSPHTVYQPPYLTCSFFLPPFISSFLLPISFPLPSSLPFFLPPSLPSTLSSFPLPSSLHPSLPTHHGITYKERKTGSGFDWIWIIILTSWIQGRHSPRWCSKASILY